MKLHKQTITVFGNVFVDIKGGAFRPVHKDAKNVGQVNIVHGGAARNVVHNLALLGADTRFVSSYTIGGLGDEVVSALQAMGVDTSLMRGYRESGMGMWLAVFQPNGDLVASISEQPNLANQQETIFSALDQVVTDSAAIALDVGISHAVNREVMHACREHSVPVYGLVGNLDAVERHPDILQGMDVFLCNAEEASILAGHSVQDEETARHAAKRIRDYGCRCVIVTLAENGCIVLDEAMAAHVPARDVALVDSTGAGDSFFSGFIYASVVQQDNPCAAAGFASEIAARVVASTSNTLG